MFLLYIDDIADKLECGIHMHEDDAVLMAKYKDDAEDCCQKLNRDLEKLDGWARTWFMEFNQTKTKYTHNS